MEAGLRRYEFSERLADILGESRRDLRFRVTLMVTGGLEAPGPRGRGSPLATPQYAASLLIGCMAAPQQAHTVEAIRCYGQLRPAGKAADANQPRIVFGPPVERAEVGVGTDVPLLHEGVRFGDTVARLLELARAEETRDALMRELFGIWVSRGCPVGGVQFGAWRDRQRAILTQRFELPEAAQPPAWLDPDRGGTSDPGLFHTVFLPVRKLVEIGMLTAVPDGRRSLMLKNLGPKMSTLANMTKLARQPRFQRRWEQLLSTLGSVKAWSEKVDSEGSRLVEVKDFGSNPGNLSMFTYRPANLPPSAPLVVLLHGCTQSAASYDKGSGWSTLADRYGFALLLPQQQWKNNPLRCFNWFKPEHIARERGEALSIKQMIERMVADQNIDRRRVYVTGLSSGGAMTTVMLATYPETFAGGAILAGVPYRAANGVQDAFESIFQGQSRSPGEWGDLVRAASSHPGPWPKVSVWHGNADKTVKPTNADEIVKQWTNLHRLDPAHTIEMNVAGHRRRVWQDADGEDIIESYTISGMAHGAAVDPGDDAHQCGTAAPFFNDAGISSTFHIANFWGLVGARHDLTAEGSASGDEALGARQAGGSTESPAEPLDTVLTATREGTQTDGTEPSGSADSAGGRAGQGAGIGHQGVNVEKIIAKSLEMAGLLKGARGGSGKTEGSPLGIDVHGIIATSLEAAGLLKKGASDELKASRAQGGGAPLGIDVPGIIATALEAAGALNSSRAGPLGAGIGKRDLASFGWEGKGWDLLVNDPRAFRGGPMLYGHASSGIEDGLGRKVQSVSRQMSLGARPELSYVRRISLGASANQFTSASFRVLVDGVPVDEVSSIGMDYAETEWTRRAGIDLGQFANRTVTLSLEVVATSNVRSEVFAKAWIDELTVGTAREVEEV
jgi:feruloyl esterase